MPRRMQRCRRPLLFSPAAGAVLLAGLTGTRATLASTTTAAPPARPNVVFVLTDDLSWNLVRYMPQVRQLQNDGRTFTDYTVTDSLCCPSRSSIFTGRFPHDTGVFTNGGSDGGLGYFHGHGEEAQTFAAALSAQGDRTPMMGKYLNGYDPAATPARAACRDRLPRPARAARPGVGPPPPHRPAGARRPHAVASRRDRQHRHPLPQAGAGRPGGGQDDRQPAGDAAVGRGRGEHA